MSVEASLGSVYIMRVCHCVCGNDVWKALDGPFMLHQRYLRVASMSMRGQHADRIFVNTRWLLFRLPCGACADKSLSARAHTLQHNLPQNIIVIRPNAAALILRLCLTVVVGRIGRHDPTQAKIRFYSESKNDASWLICFIQSTQRMSEFGFCIVMTAKTSASWMNTSFFLYLPPTSWKPLAGYRNVSHQLTLSNETLFRR